MKKLTFIAMFVVLFGIQIYAQKRTRLSKTQTATTETGEQVILRADGTWIYKEKSSQSQIQEKDGIKFRLIDCRKDLQSRKINCAFDLTNLKEFKDDTRIYKNGTKFTDSSGNQVTADVVQTANRNDDVTILPNRTIRMNIRFDLADPKSNRISQLIIARSNNMGNVNQFIEFTDIALTK